MRIGPASPYLVLVAIVALARWIPGMTSSLWLDETVTHWIVSGDVADTLHRGTHYGTDPGYYLIAHGLAHLLGSGEVALRLPSLLAMLLAIFCLYRLGGEMLGREAGAIAAALFASSDIVLGQGANARPYAIASAVLVATAWALWRWVRSGRLRAGLAFALGAALLVHVKCLFALALPAFAAYAWFARPRPPMAQLAGAAAIVAIGGALYGPVFALLLARSGIVTWAATPGPGDLVGAYVWPQAVLGLLVGLLVAWLSRSGGRLLEARAPAAPTALLLALWALVPPLACFAVAALTPSQVFVNRFYMAAAPAIALLYAQLFVALPTRAARLAATAVAVAASLFAFYPATEDATRLDDFRGAAAAIRDFAGGRSIPVLVAAGLAESRDEAWRSDPERASYLLAPFAYYDTGGTLVALPPQVLGGPPMEKIAREHLWRARRFAVVERSGTLVLAWFEQYARQRGYRVRHEEFRGVRVDLFQRSTGS